MVKPWRLVGLVAVADVLLLVGSIGVAVSLADDGPTRREVAGRPWPGRVEAPGPWSSTLRGTGQRMEITVPGVAVGGIAGASLDVADTGYSGADFTRYFDLPDRTKWYPKGRVRLQGGGDLGFSTATASGTNLSLSSASLEQALGSASGVTAVGSFVRGDGEEADRLPLPAGTRVSVDCRSREPGGCPRQALGVTIEVSARPGLSVRAGGDSEVAVAGSGRASALGRTWDGLVMALDAKDLQASAEYLGSRWTVTSEATTARQLWVDVWPVIDTTVSARSQPNLRQPSQPSSVQLRWTNTGFATAHIFEIEGRGPGAPTTALDPAPTVGHDAGLKVRRDARAVNLREGENYGGDLGPGGDVGRDVAATIGQPASLVLRGNFPEVHVTLAVASA